jgi:hypothetical protein
MQDEVTKHTKKIYDTLKNPNHTVGEKVRETIIEVLIIVFAVTLSIWLHSWSEHRHEQKEVREFLRGLKDDLTKDIDLLNENKNVIVRLDSNFGFLLNIVNSQAGGYGDSVINEHFRISIPLTNLNIGRYDGFKSSGKIGTIENDSLKENILVFYQQTIPNLTYNENFVNSLQLKILDLQMDKTDKTAIKDLISTFKMKALLRVGVNNFNIGIGLYEETIKQAKRIIEEIDRETEE